MDKKNKVKIIIAVAVLFVLVVGATYAYFTMGVTTLGNSSVIRVQARNNGLVTLSSPVSELYIKLKASDMSLANQRKYYATNLDTESYKTEQNAATYSIARLTVTDGKETAKYQCTADIKLELDVTDGSMGAALKEGDMFIHLSGASLNEEELDLSELSTIGTKTYSNVTFNIEGNTSQDIQAYAYIENTENEQNHLAGKALNLTIKTENLKCVNNVDGPVTAYLKSQKNSGLSKEIVGGMYRYQGTNDQVNNYLCLEGKCSSGSDDMYRIIGVTPEGNIKVIKQTRYGSAMKWWTGYSGIENNKEWLDADIFETLNTNFYNSLDTIIQGKIQEWEYMYGDISNEYINSNISTDTAYQIETGQENTKYYDPDSGDYIEDQKWTEKVSANIGLMYIHDYAYALGGTGSTSSCIQDYADCKTSWIHMSNNGGATTGKEQYEWTMTRRGRYSSPNPYFGAWFVSSDGRFNYSYLSAEYVVRPVFYLKNDIQLYGSGTTEDPFTLTKVIPTEQENYLREYDTTNALSSTLVGGMYRYQGSDTLNGNKVNNYICLSEVGSNGCTSAKTNGYDDNMYRIIGITEEGSIKVIKQTKYGDTTTWFSSYTTNIEWINSYVYTSLNTTFYNNLNSEIKEKIESQKWLYGDIGNDLVDSEHITAEQAYKIETGQATTKYLEPLTKKSITDQKWTKRTELVPIGLMYIHDYAYALGGTGSTSSCIVDYANCKTSWIHMSNNGNNSNDEWIMTRLGQGSSGNTFYAWAVLVSGTVGGGSFNYFYAVRPVFYLTNDVKLEGAGTTSDPFYIAS